MKLRTARIWLWFMIPATALGVYVAAFGDMPWWRVLLLIFQVVVIMQVIADYRIAKLAGKNEIW